MFFATHHMWGCDFDCDLGKRKTDDAAAHVLAVTGGRQWGCLKRDVAVMRRWAAPRRGERNTKWSGGKRKRACDAVVTPHAHKDWSPWQPSPPGFTQCQLKIASVFPQFSWLESNLLLGFEWNYIFSLSAPSNLDRLGTEAYISWFCQHNKW